MSLYESAPTGSNITRLSDKTKVIRCAVDRIGITGAIVTSSDVADITDHIAFGNKLATVSSCVANSSITSIVMTDTINVSTATSVIRIAYKVFARIWLTANNRITLATGRIDTDTVRKTLVPAIITSSTSVSNIETIVIF
jgi:hypothetical protein